MTSKMNCERTRANPIGGRSIWITITAAYWVYLGAAAAAGCGPVSKLHATDTQMPEAIPVRLGAVERGPLARRVFASGTVQARSELDLSFRLGGTLTLVGVEAGARVKRGQLLARVDPTPANAARAQAVEAMRKAQRDVARLEALHANGAIGAVDLEVARTNLAVARAVEQAAQYDARQTWLVAPDDGVIDRRLVELGEFAAAGRPVFSLRSASRGAVVRAQIVDREALKLRVGDVARVRLDAKPEVEIGARISRIATIVSSGTGTLEVELQLEVVDAMQLPNGLTAKVEIERSEHPSASVPLSAVVDGDGSAAAVYVIDGEHAKRIPVQVSFLAQERAALVGDLPQVDSVIDLGVTRLENGTRVRVTQ
jgi:RND family efflux transporter MFP subunit